MRVSWTGRCSHGRSSSSASLSPNTYSKASSHSVNTRSLRRLVHQRFSQTKFPKKSSTNLRSAQFCLIRSDFQADVCDLGLRTGQSQIRLLRRTLRTDPKHRFYLLRRSSQALEPDWFMAHSIRTSPFHGRDFSFHRLRLDIYRHTTGPLITYFDL